LDGRKVWVEKHPENLEEIQHGLKDARGFVALRAVADLIVGTNPQVAGYVQVTADVKCHAKEVLRVVERRERSLTVNYQKKWRWVWNFGGPSIAPGWRKWQKAEDPEGWLMRMEGEQNGWTKWAGWLKLPAHQDIDHLRISPGEIDWDLHHPKGRVHWDKR